MSHTYESTGTGRRNRRIAGAVAGVMAASAMWAVVPASALADPLSPSTGARVATSGYPTAGSGGDVFYVNASTGNDSNSGLSPSQAWRTPAKVGSSTFGPGDVIASYGSGAQPVLTNPGEWNTGGTVISEIRYGAAAGYTQFVVTLNSGSNTSVVVHAGYWGPGSSSWEQIDDWSLTAQ